jgi:F0F1-type ATP synthase membrane subunit b/b'
MTSVRWLLAATLLAALVVGARVAPVSESIGVTAVLAAAQSDAHAQDAPAGKKASGEEHEAGSGWGATIAKTVNFAILVSVLVYFLKTPITAYLTGRISKVREDLIAARQTRETAARQLAEIDAKLKALPLELETLKQRGAEDIVAERTRIEEAAEAERQRLLEHTRREIEMRLRIARRELLELTADRAMTVAREAIAHAITPDDQARLVDRYASQLQGQAGGGRPEVRL